jgi:hypothetical protein
MADTNKLTDSAILGPAQKHLLDKEARDHSRRQDIIHPSELVREDFCPLATYRRIKLLREGGSWDKPAFGFQTLNIFAHGNEIHHKWQTWLWEMGYLWGTWHCHSCDTWWTALSPRECPVCERRHLSYEEVELDLSEDLLISGSADGAIPHLKSLIEIKTVGAGTLRFENPELLAAHTHRTRAGKELVDYEGLWRGISVPFPAHLRQGQLYLYLAREMRLPYTQIIYIYESKMNQGTKEFTVQYRESTALPLIARADAVREALAGGPPPACPHGGCKHCMEKGTNDAASPSLPPTGITRRATRRPRPPAPPVP